MTAGAAASPQVPATSSPLTAEDAERFASVLKPMWELDSAPQPAAPIAIASRPPPSSRSQAAAPVVTVKPRQPNGTLATAPFPAIIAPAPSRDSSHEFDDLAQLPRGPSAAPEAMAAAAAAPTEPAQPEPLNAFAVEAHLPPRRQQISEPRASVEVDAPPQTVSSPDVGRTGSGDFGDFGHAAAVAQASFGPTPEQLRARAARGQPTVLINKDDIVGFPGRRSRAPLIVGIGVAALVAAGAGVFLLNAGRAASAPPLATSTGAPASMGAVAAEGSSAMAIPPPAPVEAADPDPTQSAPTPASAVAATLAPSAVPAAAPPPAVAPIHPAAVAAVTTPVSAGGAWGAKAAAGGKAAPKPVHKAPGGIVRSSPF